MNKLLLDAALDPMQELMDQISASDVLTVIGLVIGAQVVAGIIIAVILISKKRKRRNKE